MSDFEIEKCVLCGAAVTAPEYEVMDGYICPACAGKLSPWMADLELAETEELEAQIRAREENRRLVAGFRPGRKFGEDPMILVDRQGANFAVARTRDLVRENPDIIPLENVISCSVQQEEEKEELLDGGESYRPKRFAYRYWLKVEISLEHPYLNEIVVPLNREPVVIEAESRGFLGMGSPDPEESPEFCRWLALAEKIEAVLAGDEEPGEDRGEYDVDPEEFFGAPESAGGERKICPWCGQPTHPDKNGCCEHCGGNL